MLKIKQKIVSASLCYLLPSVVFAEFPEEGVRQNISSQNTAVQVQQKQWLDILSEEERSPEKNENIGRPTLVNDDFLAANPHILEDALVQALNSNSADLVSSLVALYCKQPNHNPKLITRADALLAKLKGRTSEAVERYRTLYESDVSDDRVLLDLAAAEFQDYRLGDAAAHFRQAAQRDIPAPVLENVKRFQEAVKRQTEWKLSGGISPVHNDNANNAAPRYCIETRGQTACSVTLPVSANGLNYELNTEKLTPLYGHHAIKFRANLSGTSYFFDRQSAYDDAFGRAYLGWQRKDGKQTVSVLPFYQAQLAGSSEFDSKKENKRRAAPYMLAHGVGVQLSHMVNLSNATQLYYSLERYRQNYRETDRALRNDGWHDSTYLSLARRFGRTTLFGGWQYNRFVPENKSIHNAINNAAYHRNGFNIGWIQQWQVLGGLNSRLTASFANRRYKGIMAFGTESQRNRERSLSISLSHNKLSYKGITPTLNYSYSHTRSNAPYAMRNIHQWSLGGEWNF